MESFDQSLKYLLEHEPEDFLRFGLNGEPLEALSPVESALPSRGRDVDGSYLFTSRGVQKLAHIEFHRRHQGQDELAIDVAEAQVRLFRRVVGRLPAAGIPRAERKFRRSSWKPERGDREPVSAPARSPAEVGAPGEGRGRGPGSARDRAATRRAPCGCAA